MKTIIDILRYEDGKNYLTAKEISEKIGLSHSCVLRRLNQLNRAGLLEIGRKKIQKLDGTLQVIAAYRLKPGGNKRKK